MNEEISATQRRQLELAAQMYNGPRYAHLWFWQIYALAGRILNGEVTQ